MLINSSLTSLLTFTKFIPSLLLSIGLTVSLAVGAPSSVHAQESAPEVTTEATPDTTSETPAKTDVENSDSTTTVLDAITVNPDYRRYFINSSESSTKTNTPLVNVPQSVHALPAALLEDQAAKSIGDAIRNAPGISTHQGEGNRDQYVIRGVATKADFFIDGVRDDSEYFRDLYNAERVDILQGSSALLFGRGNAGGAINLITKKPGKDPVRDVTLKTDSYGLLRGNIDVGQGLGENFAFRLNAIGQNDKTYRDEYYGHRWGINPTLRYWASEDTVIDFSYSHLDDDIRADRGIPSRNGAPVDIDPSAFFGSIDQNKATTKVDTAALSVTHNLSEKSSIRNTFTFQGNDKLYQNLFPGSAADAAGALTLSGYSHTNARTSFFDSLDFQFETETGSVKHQLLLGLDFGIQHDDDERYTADTTAPGCALNVTLTNRIINGCFTDHSRHNILDANSQALVIQDQMSFSDEWLGLLGVRYERFSVKGDYLLKGKTSDRTDNVFSPRAGVIYKPTDSSSVYASISQSFTPIGSNLGISLKSPDNTDFPPEIATNYEVGHKLNFADGALSLTTALFLLDLDNVLSKDPNDTNKIVQTGKQRNQGAEISLFGNLTSRLNVTATYAYIDARIESDTKDAKKGAVVGLVPYNQASIWGAYSVTDNWGVAGGLHGRTEVKTSFKNTVELPAHALMDLMTYYKFSDYRVQLNLNNVFDKRYFVTANGDNQITPGAPFNASLSLSAVF